MKDSNNIKNGFIELDVELKYKKLTLIRIIPVIIVRMEITKIP